MPEAKIITKSQSWGSLRGHLVHLPVSIQNSIQERKLFILFFKIFSINCIWAFSEQALNNVVVVSVYFISEGILNKLFGYHVIETSELKRGGQHPLGFISKRNDTDNWDDTISNTEDTWRNTRLEDTCRPGCRWSKPNIKRLKAQEQAKWFSITLLAEKKIWDILGVDLSYMLGRIS